MSEPTWTPGRMVWRELMTKDIAGAKAFYGAMFGWTFQDMDMGPDLPVYPIVRAGEKGIGGIAPGGEAPTSFWMAYVSVPDVDAAVAAATAGGGGAVFGPFDVPQVGRLAGIHDFAGAVIGLLRSTSGDSPPVPPSGAEFCWETVSSPDPERAAAFYTSVFGWRTSPGPGGQGVVFGTGAGMENQVADLQAADVMPPSWLTYVVVEDSGSACAKAAGLGATVVASGIQVPGVGVIAVIRDPVGAFVGLFQPTMG